MPTPEKKRRKRGEGSVFYNPRRGVWIGRVPLGRGKYRQVSHAKQAACVQLMREQERPRPDTTVSEWSSRWLESISHRAPLYVDNCRRSVKYRINPVLGHLRLRDLTTFDVEDAIRKWSTKLGPGSVGIAVQHLGNLCQSAVRAEVILRNPVSAVRRPPVAPRAVQPFTAAELRKIIRIASSMPRTRPIAVLAATGCRMGELLALDAGDYRGGMLAITKGDRMAYGIGPTKTRNSVRTIRVPDEAQRAATDAKAGRIRGPLWMADGKRMTRHMMNREWRWVLRACGVEYRNPHQCRHSVGSLMIGSGASIADVARYLGDTVQTVVRTYLHATGADPSGSIDRLLTGVVNSQPALYGEQKHG